ncbi:unnamed protein product [Acanthoscelides obtectus]|uniref:27 kDa hemolymph protein n=1 Tax=Acanthoscelides obtectus TaxID=200917 RepID=A0A9P0K4V2_ACAOB|nr:unnamed protein product [Acanthoscelides obtectus]CAK1648010.1 hypothetical protein AOBTE_LOCUS15499 [Acanthoscelides obtectus]
MFNKSAAVLLLAATIGLVYSQTFNDLDSDDNLKKIQEHLPPELANLNMSSLPKLEQVEKVLREKCQKVSGSDNAVDLLKTEQVTAKECMEKYINASIVQEELERAKDTGSMDEVFGKYCKKWPDIQVCFENATTFARQCMDNQEQNAFNSSLTILQELQEFVCFKDGDRLAMFVAEGGIECVDEQKQGVQDCLNKTLGARLPETNELSITNIPTFLFSAKECEDFETVRTCINAELEKCKDSTPANIVDAFFKFLKKQMPCGEGSVHAKEVAASTQEKTSTASTSTITLFVSLLPLLMVTFTF